MIPEGHSQADAFGHRKDGDLRLLTQVEERWLMSSRP
jgi:hypothetical protein